MGGKGVKLIYWAYLMYGRGEGAGGKWAANCMRTLYTVPKQNPEMSTPLVACKGTPTYIITFQCS